MEEVMAKPTYTIYKRVRVSAGKWRYRKAAFSANGKIKPDVVIVDGREDKHAGDYYLNHKGRIPVNGDALEAQRWRAEGLSGNFVHVKLETAQRRRR
jgi:hypothetical protein